jgi:uncharacterized radical SAM superfamily Fe-S cluster-containing enzyme
MQLNILTAGRRASTSFSEGLEAARAQLLLMSESDAIHFFELHRFDRLLKSTLSLCPACLGHVPAIVYEIDGRVLMSKRCPDHGLSLAVVENEATFYHLSNKDRWGRRFADDRVLNFPTFAGSNCCDGNDCCESAPADAPENVIGNLGFADQMSNKTCTVLVEVTNACNLACPVCYSDARGDRKMPLDLFKRYMTRLVEQKNGLDSVQLTGGEATLHPEFLEMVAFLHQLAGVKRIYLPTNGILLARRQYAERLVPFKDKLMVLLQFDGRNAAANEQLRNANTAAIRQKVIRILSELGMYLIVCFRL